MGRHGACSFGQAQQQYVNRLSAEVDALKAAHAKRDDDMGRLVDDVTSQLAAAREGVRAKQDLIQSSEASMQRLHSEACTPVIPAAPMPASRSSPLCYAHMPASKCRLGKANIRPPGHPQYSASR